MQFDVSFLKLLLKLIFEGVTHATCVHVKPYTNNIIDKSNSRIKTVDEYIKSIIILSGL